MKNIKTIYIRKENNQKEYRTPLIPKHVNILVSNGITVIIESSINRIFSDNEYELAGGIITNKHWSLFQHALIIGIKELDNLHLLNKHIHIYFSHSYLGQYGSNLILKSFVDSSSLLYDFEFFTDHNSNRLISFCYWAGFIGVFLGLNQFYNKFNHLVNLKNLTYFNNIQELVDLTNKFIFNLDVKVAIIGNGKTSKGAQEFCKYFNLNFIIFSKSSDKKLLIDYGIVINCIKLNENNKETWFDINTPFYKNIIIVDVSCDYTKSNNPIKIYNKETDWINPVYSYNNFVDIIAINNLPSLIPRESSIEFSTLFIDLLLDFESDTNLYWEKNKNIYLEKIKNI